MIKINCFGKLDETISGDKLLLVRTRYRKWNNKLKRNERLFHEPILKKSKYLTKDDYIGTPINKTSIMFKSDLSVNRSIFWWYIGRFLADGWCIRYKRSGRKNSYATRVILCCGKHEFDEVNNKMLELGYNFHISEERTGYKFIIVNRELFDFMVKFGKYAYGKFIPRKIINMPQKYLKHLIIGYISGDGYYDKVTKLYKATTTSKELLSNIQECIMKVYKVPVRVYYTKRPKTCVIEGRVVNQRDTYQVVYKLDAGKQDNAFSDNKYVWGPINKMVTTP